MPAFEQSRFRASFPLLSTQFKIDTRTQPLVYFDNGATTQKPQAVLDAYQFYYQTSNANVHRASHAISAIATAAYEKSRRLVKSFIHAPSIEEVIWSKGTTESINLIAQTWGRANLEQGDEIVLSQSEHHANIVPWQIVAKQTGAIIKVLPLTNTGIIDVAQIAKLITTKTKLVSIAHLSNVIGKINPIETIIAQAKSVGAITVIDGAQAIAHQRVNVQQLDCDFYVFSAHKMYGPTGVGVLYGKKALLEAMPVYQGGGEMIEKVSFAETSYNKLPFKFEAGTPNIAGVIAFAKAIEFLDQQDVAVLAAYEQKLTQYCYQQLSEIVEVEFIVEDIPDIPLLSFTVTGHHNHDVSATLDSYGIALRSGHHCAMPLMAYLNRSGCLRISLAPYNTLAEIDYFIKTLKKIIADELSHPNEVFIDNGTKNNHDEAASMVGLFAKSKAWDQRHRQIMLLGKDLPRMDKALRSEQTLIHGCESLAWLSYQQQATGEFVFMADSDAKVIRGLMVIVLAAFNHKTPSQINTFDLETYFQTLGLLQHLSPSRGNGLKAIVDKIKAIANNEAL